MFENVRVLDFTRVFSGPFCSQMLAELGADVIKVEEPTNGDETRSWYPTKEEWSGYFMALNRSKRSLTLNLKKEEARKVIEKLVENTDVVIENFAPGVAERLGISYELLQEINPKIIYLSMSAYGQTGPNRISKGYDPIIQADAGIMSLTGERGGPPVKTMFPLADISTALYGAFTVAASLFKRSERNEGEYIDLALYDSVVSLLGILAAIPFFKGEIPERLGSEHPHRVPSRNYETGDGVFVHLICNNSQWLKLCNILQLDEKFKRKPYSTDLGRLENREEIDEQVQMAMLKKPSKEWLGLFNKEGVPCAIVNDLNQVLNSEQTTARELLVMWQQGNLGDVVGLNFPYKFRNSETKVTRPVPELGEHTVEILKEIGFEEQQINALKKNGII